VAGPQQKSRVKPSQTPGLFAGQDPNRRCIEPKFARFFAQNYGPVAAMAGEYDLDPVPPLGLAGFESGWGESRMARIQNNPFGSTPDGAKGVSYPSIPEAWQSWGRQWGPRVRGVRGDEALFIKKLQEDNWKKKNAVDQRRSYNSDHPTEWAKGVAEGVRSVRRRLEDWKKYGC
jgi:hypothetical protein